VEQKSKLLFESHLYWVHLWRSAKIKSKSEKIRSKSTNKL